MTPQDRLDDAVRRTSDRFAPLPRVRRTSTLLGTPALVLGCVALLLGWAPPLGLLTGAAAVVLAVVARRHGARLLVVAAVVTAGLGALLNVLVIGLMTTGVLPTYDQLFR